MPDPHYSELILSHQQPTLSSVLSTLRRATLSPHNRLASIRADAAFVSRAAAGLGPGRPLVANERCGSWYVPPAAKAASAYFKSTDGHERAWKFSTRRLNLHLVPLVESNDGIIIVDSTRRGKRMPDALSTTIPIWCTVINLALLPDHPLSSKLFLPPYLPASTHAQITALIPQFLESLLALKLDLPQCLTKPLRPFWVTQDSALPGRDDDDDGNDVQEKASIFDDYRPVICCTASRRVLAGSEADEGGYIQGAGDDTENWAHGLTAPIFWAHADELLAASDADLPDLIARLLEKESENQRAAADDAGSKKKQLTRNISVCSLPVAPDPSLPNQCCIAITQESTAKDKWVRSSRYMEVGLGKSKAASRNLRLALPEICSFASQFLSGLSSSDAPRGDLVIACESGKDLSVGTALALSCYLFDEQGSFRTPDKDVSFTKSLVKIRLGSIMTTFPEANPSRATLQSVNSFLMDWRN
ncbi:2'-O-ribosyl phosphate transferase RIT1 [Paramyrothecium foliicola]|nr:2'-O-ribosyl phosphate transferase RIT1 [Paramyrothecium foliicola]